MFGGAVVYDTETYPNCFLLGVVDLYSDAQFMFEMSEYRDDSDAMFEMLRAIQYYGAEMIGFNNLNFDYPILHDLLSQPSLATYQRAYEKAQSIINARNRWAHQIWANNRYIRQIDLYRLNHFDNFAKQTSLKELQFTMRAETIEDLPIAPGTHLTREQVEINKSYCFHDCGETKRFANFCQPDIEFRRGLVDRFNNDDALNWSEIKIGSEYLIADLGKRLCYYYDANNKRQIRQTERDKIPVAEIILPYVRFNRPETNALFEEMKAKVIVDTKAAFKASCEINGFTFDFGTGGVHGSQQKTAFHADEEHAIIDVDVTSLYPHLIIVNRMYPEHLGERFIDRYADALEARKKCDKESFERRLYKYALVGVYGNSNNPWSPFYDPRLTMQVTINGQLSLLMLAESLFEVASLELIQANTDGITLRCKRSDVDEVMRRCQEWEETTKLPLEYNRYTSFFCRDVNNYLAVGEDGKIKRKGAYEYLSEWKEYNGWWHKNWSAQVVPRAAEAELTGKCTVEEFLATHADAFDFMLRAKCPRSSALMYDGKEQQRITRYYASTDGAQLVKESPPVEGAEPGAYKRKNGIDDATYYSILREIPKGTWDERIHTKNKSVYGERVIKIHSQCAVCNDMKQFRWDNLDRDWYADEARKLVDCFYGEETKGA